MISNRCIYDLVRVEDDTSKVPSIESFPLVNEFPDDFFDELPSVPPKREIDLGIDLLQDTQLILIPPYWMAPVELKNLMEQSRDFLVKDFIRPNWSP